MDLEPKVKGNKMIVEKVKEGKRMSVLLEKPVCSIVPNADGETHTIVCIEGNTVITYPKARVVLEFDDNEMFAYADKVNDCLADIMKKHKCNK